MQRKIDLLINKLLNPLVKDYRYALLEKIINNNEEIFGVILAKNITPYEILSFIEKKEPKYLLKIIVPNASVALKVDFQKERILNNIGLYTGEKNITKLRIGHSNEEDGEEKLKTTSIDKRLEESFLSKEQ